MGNIDAVTIWFFLVIAGMVLTMIMPNLFAEPCPTRRRQLQVQGAKWISRDRSHTSPRVELREHISSWPRAIRR